MEAEYGLPATALIAMVVATGITTGLIVGLLNRWVASRVAALLVGALAAWPTSACVAYLQLTSVGKLSASNLLIQSVLIAIVSGGLGGAILYAKTDRCPD